MQSTSTARKNDSAVSQNNNSHRQAQNVVYLDHTHTFVIPLSAGQPVSLENLDPPAGKWRVELDIDEGRPWMQVSVKISGAKGASLRSWTAPGTFFSILDKAAATPIQLETRDTTPVELTLVHLIRNHP